MTSAVNDLKEVRDSRKLSESSTCRQGESILRRDETHALPGIRGGKTKDVPA